MEPLGNQGASDQFLSTQRRRGAEFFVCAVGFPALAEVSGNGIGVVWYVEGHRGREGPFRSTQGRGGAEFFRLSCGFPAGVSVRRADWPRGRTRLMREAFWVNAF